MKKVSHLLLATAVILSSHTFISASPVFAGKIEKEELESGSKKPAIIPVSKALSKESQGTLTFFNTLIQGSGQKLFSGMPENPDNKEAWAKKVEDTEQFLTSLNHEVKEKLKPTVKRITLNGVPVLEVTPQNWDKSDKILVCAHGGGFTTNTAENQLIASAPLAHASGLKTYVVDYTRAPFAKQPQILDQFIRVFQGLTDKKGMNIKMEKIGIFGDSAGANIAAATLLKMNEMKLGMPGAAVFMSPWLDLTGSGKSYKEKEPIDPILSPESLERCALAYAPKEDHKNPYVSPLFSDFKKGFAPTLIQHGSLEMLEDDSKRFEEKLRDAGQTVTRTLYDGMWHCAQAFQWQLPESQNALQEAATFMNKYLEK